MELGGLRLLMPLTKSKDMEVKRLAAHALANLSVDGEVTLAAPGLLARKPSRESPRRLLLGEGEFGAALASQQSLLRHCPAFPMPLQVCRRNEPGQDGRGRRRGDAGPSARGQV